MSNLFAGPWVGEFGWELFNWQGHVRWMSEFYGKTIVACRPTSKYLYEDFADEIIEVDPGSWETDANRCYGYEYDNMHLKIPHEFWLNPFNLKFYTEKHGVPTIGNKKQQFIVFGEDLEQIEGYDIIFHARSTEKRKTDSRNWDRENWEFLVNKFKGLRIASTGTVEGALHIEGTDDIRSVGVKKDCQIYRNSRLIIGPSSGPMHLGSLCKTPHLVWSGLDRNKYRYHTLWNPHNTFVRYFDEMGWQPSPEKIVALIEEILS